MKRTLLWLAALLAFCGAAHAQDFQSWNELDLLARWKHATLLVPLVARIDPAQPNPQFAATGALITVPVARHLELSTGYLTADLPFATGWVHVPVGIANLIVRPSRYTFADASRIEKLQGYSDNPWRYRNLVFAQRAFGATRRTRLFANNECFVNLTDRVWNQNRFQAGASRTLSPRLTANLFYLQKNARGATKTTYVLGADLQILLTRPRSSP